MALGVVLAACRGSLCISCGGSWLDSSDVGTNTQARE